MVYNISHLRSDVIHLKKELSDLKLLVNDRLSSQVRINCEMRAKMELMQSKYKQLSALIHQMEVLTDKFKDQKGRMKLLVQLLRGKFEQRNCDNCGRKMKVLLVEEKKKNEEEVDKNEGGLGILEASAPPFCCEDNGDTRLEEDKSCEFRTDGNRDAASYSSFYSYSEKEINKFNKSVSGGRWRHGRIDRLDDYGQWQFKLGDESTGDVWSRIASGGGGWMESRPLILFQELSGLAVIIGLWGIAGYEGRNRFLVRLCALDCNENERVSLPVEVNIVVKLRQLDDTSYRLSNSHKFKLDYLGDWAQPDNFFVSIDKSRKDALPEIIFSFSK